MAAAPSTSLLWTVPLPVLANHGAACIASPAAPVQSGTIFSVPVIVNTGTTNVLSSLFELAPIRWLGRLSYSLYLWQQLFCFQSTGPWFEHFPVNVLAALAFAAASYYFIEQPFLRWRDRLRHKPALPPSGAST